MGGIFSSGPSLTKEEIKKTKDTCRILNRVEKTTQKVGPILIVGGLGWPIIWLYRGLQWPKVRTQVDTRNYICRTHNIASLFGLCSLLAAALVAAIDLSQEEDENNKKKQGAKPKAPVKKGS